MHKILHSFTKNVTGCFLLLGAYSLIGPSFGLGLRNMDADTTRMGGVAFIVIGVVAGIIAYITKPNNNN